MRRRWKIRGYVTDWPFAVIHIDGEEWEVELADPPLPSGTYFTMHFRGQRFLYRYVPTRPLITRAQVKRARIEARHLHRVLFPSP